MTPNTIICGKSEKVMKEFPNNHFDAIVTDIPYGIGFMGKEWDTFKRNYLNKHRVADRKRKPRTDGRTVAAWNDGADAGTYDYSRNAEYQEWCRIWSAEALRIVKPGAHLLCFGGTRTFHRLTCGLEDAGWQIRDCVMYMYGSGFPKSLNCAKAILKMMLREFLQDDYHFRYTSVGFQCDCQDNCRLCDELFQFFQVTGQDIEQKQADVPKRNHLSETLRQILLDNEHNDTASYASLSFRPAKRGYLCQIILRGEQGVQEKGVALSAPCSEQSTRGESVHAGSLIGKDLNNKYALSCEVDVGKLEQFCRTYDTVSLPYNHCKIAYHFCQAQKAIGYGTALKPAWEPIVVAMKPLDGTFAANAEKYGVAGLNIDGGRISLDGEKQPSGSAKRVYKSNQFTTEKIYGDNKVTPRQGRWPANVILDEEAAAMLDEQSKTSTTGNRRNKNRTQQLSINTPFTRGQNAPEYTDKGGASRFFYCAKASKAERNAGLKGMPEKRPDDRTDIGKGIWIEKGTAKQTNHHPTVKPLALMEYLCRLLKPPSEHPILLDPFCGSGTTLMAAVNTGWDYVGIEKEKDYCEIAKKRVEQQSGQMPLFKDTR